MLLEILYFKSIPKKLRRTDVLALGAKELLSLKRTEAIQPVDAVFAVRGRNDPGREYFPRTLR